MIGFTDGQQIVVEATGVQVNGQRQYRVVYPDHIVSHLWSPAGCELSREDEEMQIVLVAIDLYESGGHV